MKGSATPQSPTGRLVQAALPSVDLEMPGKALPHKQRTADREDLGPRSILRVPEILIAVASAAEGQSLTDLVDQLQFPKTSLHRLLRTLEQGGYLTLKGGLYAPGPESLRLAGVISQVARIGSFPHCARPVLEWLARKSGETVMLATLSDQRNEIAYVDVIESEAPLRFALPPGIRPPLYSVATGKAMLAFSSDSFQRRYMKQTEFVRFTPYTTRKRDLPALLSQVRSTGVVLESNGTVDGASCIASPAFDRKGNVFCAISIAGPTDRVLPNQQRLEELALTAGERLSRTLGYDGSYPPPAEE